MAVGYDQDKGAFAYGVAPPSAAVSSLKNLVSNTGVISADVTGVGTARNSGMAVGFSLSA